MKIDDAYVRVSDTYGEEDGLSAADQLEQIKGWIDQHDDDEIGLRPEDGLPFTDLDVSGLPRASLRGLSGPDARVTPRKLGPDGVHAPPVVRLRGAA
jgi:hypothetical protein